MVWEKTKWMVKALRSEPKSEAIPPRIVFLIATLDQLYGAWAGDVEIRPKYACIDWICRPVNQRGADRRNFRLDEDGGSGSIGRKMSYRNVCIAKVFDR